MASRGNEVGRIAYRKNRLRGDIDSGGQSDPVVEMVDLMVLLPMLATSVLTPYPVPHLLNTCGTVHHPILVVQCSGIPSMLGISW